MPDSTNPKDALGVKKAPLRFVPPALAIVASDAMADGAAKYGAFNWRETAVRLTVYLEAIERHLLALKDGQDRAEDSGHLHLSHIAACCAIIADAAGIGKLIDDRPSAGPATDMLRDRDMTTGGTQVVFDAPLPRSSAIKTGPGGLPCDTRIVAERIAEREPGTGPAEHVAAFVAATEQPAPFAGFAMCPGCCEPAEYCDGSEPDCLQPHTAGIVGAKVRVTERNLSVPCGALGTIIAVGTYGVVGEFPGIGGTHYMLTGMFEVVA